MPITYERDDQSCRINVRLSGAVTVEDLLAVVDRQAAESTWHYSLSYDARQITNGAASRVEDVRRVLRRTVETSAKYGQRGPVAIITGKPADYNIVRMYAALDAPQRITVEIFRDPDDAIRWLEFVRAPKRAVNSA
jgi:hypothetical protein